MDRPTKLVLSLLARMPLPPTLPLLPLLFSLSLLPPSAVAQNNGTVFVGSSLSTGDPPWLSPSSDFAFGFSPIDNGNYLLAIWYNKLANRTVVWYANGDTPAPRGSKVNLVSDYGLVLSNPQGGQLWRTNISGTEVAYYGFMNDTGNFVIGSRDSDLLWQSFNEPTDTILPHQTIDRWPGPGSRWGVVQSRRTETNFSRGRFQLRLLLDGNLVLNTVNMDTDLAYDAYYISGTYDPSNSTNSGKQLIFNSSGYLYVLRGNGDRFDLTKGRVNPATDYYHRATLNFDGVFTQYYHPKNSTASGGDDGWKPVWTQPENICLNIGGQKGSGACGFNSICRLEDDQRPTCRCPKGFSLLDKNDTYGSCEPNFVQDCRGGGEDGLDSGSAEEAFDFTELPNTNWPTSDYEQLKPFNEEDCRKSCLRDCMCAVVIFGGDSCWKKKLPLSNGVEGTGANGKALIKVRKDGSPPSPRNRPDFPVPDDRRKDSNRGTIILVVSVLLGSSVFVNLVLTVAVCIGLSFVYRKKVLRPEGNNIAGTNVRCFSYEELVRATDGFKEELGRGSFGIVYKGALASEATSKTTTSYPIAVKKLDRVLEDTEKEFRTEVNVIGKTHHKNLVRLLGFSDQGPCRLLVYELISNGTLANFLFGGKARPSWKQRTQIAIGIARGLLYLHEECSAPIIHCDLKPQNILLDDDYSARISDFGLAKLLMINQSHTQTAIRGTKGYVAPEWFRNTPISPKVDVYSFGVLLMEIVCCRRIADLEGGLDGQHADPIEWAYECLREGTLGALVEDNGEEEEEALLEYREVERFAKAGLWCVQEDPSRRPTMRKVTQMLEGLVEVAMPPSPFPPSIV